MSPNGVTGQLWPFAPLAQMTLPIVAYVGFLPAQVIYAGAAPGMVSGYFQINLQMPPNAPSGNLYIGLTIGGAPIPPQTTVAVK